jgi:hypothetical protein
MVKDWLHIHDFHPSSWDEFDNVELWWTSTVLAHGGRKKAMATLFMLVAWELWNERNVSSSTVSNRKLELGLLPALNIWVFSWRESRLL